MRSCVCTCPHCFNTDHFLPFVISSEYLVGQFPESLLTTDWEIQRGGKRAGGLKLCDDMPSREIDQPPRPERERKYHERNRQQLPE